jgi:hypothetical protein
LFVAENGCRRRRKNCEIYELYNEYDIVKFMKLVDMMGWTCEEDRRK